MTRAGRPARAAHPEGCRARDPAPRPDPTQVRADKRQLADSPGSHAGMATVHKRAVGVTHRLRRFAGPALSGAMET